MRKWKLSQPAHWKVSWEHLEKTFIGRVLCNRSRLDWGLKCTCITSDFVVASTAQQGGGFDFQPSRITQWPVVMSLVSPRRKSCTERGLGSGWCGSAGWAPVCPCLGCRLGPWLGVCERQPINVSLTHQCFSSSLSPSLPLKRNKERKRPWL